MSQAVATQLEISLPMSVANLTFAREPWSPTLKSELEPLLPAHWEEVALDRGRIMLSVDWQQYARLFESGLAEVLTARNDGTLAGYFIFIITTHLHYMSSKMALADVYRLLPQYRNVSNAILFFRFVEAELRRLGVEKIVLATKLKNDISDLLAYLGFREDERVWSKVL